MFVRIRELESDVYFKSTAQHVSVLTIGHVTLVY